MSEAAVPPLDSTTLSTLEEVRRYQITSADLLDILLPEVDEFCVNLPNKRQNVLIFCPFLRHRLKRASYDWFKHPNCYQYNVDHGCMILQRFCSPEYNDGQPYDSMLDFFEEIAMCPDFAALPSDKQRKRLYRVLNDGLGGPHGAVCYLHSFSIRGYYLLSSKLR
jgi:hypothetical protein